MSMEIRALVRARLLGLQILTLDAQVAVETEGGRPAAHRRPALLLRASRTGISGPPPAMSGPPPAMSDPLADPEPGPEPGPGPLLARAVRLLEQSAETIERSRRPVRERELPD